MIYRILADSVIVVHVVFVFFVVLGGFWVIRWPRLMWVHVPSVLWGAAVEIGGWICPLTYLENHWRRMGQGAGYPGGFVEHTLLPIIYPDYWFAGGFPSWGFMMIGGGVLVVNMWVYRGVWRKMRPLGNAQ
ncbi:MAG: DUF2784 domain-containing protein [Nitrospirae bacterium]|nr:DUF2784 domain-containing protein [Magnetococcales bacterium]